MMESINLNNYEAYFLDFVEGNLSDLQIQQLHAFLESHPDLKNTLDEFELIELPNSHFSQTATKSTLLRDETTGLKVVDYLMIAQIENDISVSEKNLLSAYIAKDESLVEGLAIYHKCKLPIEKVVYENKQALLQKVYNPRIILWLSPAAAAIALFVLFNWNTAERVYHPESFSYRSTKYLESNTSLFVGLTAKEDLIQVKPKLIPEYKEAAKLSKTANQLVEAEVPSLIEQEIIQIDSSVVEIAEETPAVDLTESKSTYLIQEKKRVNPSQEYIPINTYAKQTFKKEILKDKKLSELILDEIIELANDKLSIENKKDANGKTQKFAINIGKFGYSNY